MRKLLLLTIAALCVAPMGLAHEPAGTPKNYCEPGSEWHVHDYAGGSGSIIIPAARGVPPASSPGTPAANTPLTGPFISGSGPSPLGGLGGLDGNLAGDCDGITHVDPGTPCAGFDPVDPLSSFFVGLCDADINLPIADWDEHNEYALGGAWLLVNPGPGTPGSGGTIACFGADGHHTEFGDYSVVDVVLGSSVSFSIAADRVDATSQASGGTIPPAPCGDFETDESIDCLGSCVVPFGAGLDGAYIAFVQGTAGHVIDGISWSPECSDGWDNDWDGATDWPLDPGCSSPTDHDEG